MPVLTDASMTTITDALNRWRTEMIPHGELLARQVADIDAALAELTALRAKPDAQPASCDYCRGTGIVGEHSDDDYARQCEACGGTGQQPQTLRTKPRLDYLANLLD